MAYTDNFPQRPVFQADFANGGKIDPRATFSRASTANVWDGSKHLSSYNAFTKSEGLSNWTLNNVTPTANAVVAPDGNTTGDTITGDSGTSQKYVQSNTAYDDNPVISVFAKAGTHNFIQIITNYSTGHYANFDLTSGAGAVGDVGAATTASIQAVGSTGWYRCIARFTVTNSSYVGRVVLVDSATSARFASSATTGTVHLWGAMANNQGDLTNIVAYQPSTGQIHREYAPSLVSKANNVGRFDHTTDGQSVAKGILIESQSTNLVTYSSDITQSFFTGFRSTQESNVGIAPDGTLTADLLREDSSSGNSHGVYFEYASGGTTAQTISVYAKAAGRNHLSFRFDTTNGVFGSDFVYFNLSTGAVGTTDSDITASIVSCSNGWYRCIATRTALASANGRIVLYLADADNSTSYDGDSYSGVLLWGIQAEANASHASSLISTSGATATRAAESLSVATADIGYTGGPFTVVSETEGGQGNYPTSFNLNDGTSSNQLSVYRDSANATTATNRVVYVKSDGSVQVNSSMTSSSAAGKLAVSLDTNDAAATSSGNSVTTDTSVTLPSGLSQLTIGATWTGTTKHLNGHCKRIALYNEALSDTNLQALTS